MPKVLSPDFNGKAVIKSDARRCPSCGTFTHKLEDIGSLERGKYPDISGTVDGVHIVSERFRSLLDELGAFGCDYVQVSAGFYALRPTSSVVLDFSDAPMRPSEYCKACARYISFLFDPLDSRILAAPLKSWYRIMSGERIVNPKEVVRSMQALGSDDFLVEVLIFGDEIAELLRVNARRFSGRRAWRDCSQA